MGLIWIASSIQAPALPLERVPFGDKGVHFIEYCVLGGLLGFAAMYGHVLTHWRLRVLSVWLLALAWGAIDEIHQAYVPGRQADPQDFIADVVGVTIGTALVVVPVRYRYQKLASKQTSAS